MTRLPAGPATRNGQSARARRQGSRINQLRRVGRAALLFQVMGVSASALTRRSANDNDTVASLSKRSVARRARLACLEPRLAVGQVFLSRAPVEDLFESSDDPSGI